MRPGSRSSPITTCSYKGSYPPTRELRRIAIGERKVTAPSSQSLALARRGSLDRHALERLLDQNQAGTTIRIAPDPARMPMSPGESVRRFAAAAGLKPEVGLLGSGLLAYARSVAPGVELIALDTADRTGGSAGVLPPRELSWLAAELRRHAYRHLLIASPTPLEDTRGGLAALALLDRTPGVVAVLAGDTHRSLITARRTPAGGYWLVRAPSLADYPRAGSSLPARGPCRRPCGARDLDARPRRRCCARVIPRASPASHAN